MTRASDLQDGSRQESILVVDDTPASLRLLAQMLTEHGYQVRPVPDGALAVAAAQAEPPDLILLDIRMPGMNGYEVCARLKAEPRTQDIPVIFISALDEIQDKMRAFASGGVDYVTKPFQVEEVLARVQAHLTLRRLQRQLQEANRRMEQELMLAGKVQCSLLPGRLPEVPGWQLAAALRPARETSGDFYDVIPLPDGRLGILVADVVDKGVKAALFMALSWALIRTYAREYPAQPAQALAAVSNRILEDTRADQFVSAFYGVLSPSSGELIYCNAGHNPPLLLGSGRSDAQALGRTGMVLGILEGEAWQEETVRLEPGDVLLLYTDGATDAENGRGDFFGRERLASTARAYLDRSASQLQEELIQAIRQFTGSRPQFDDIAMMVVRRDA
jgi:sigma-B regulation protein RsbU (phosphoserine phosphatase)